MESVATTTLLSALVYLVLLSGLWWKYWKGEMVKGIIRYVDGAFEEDADGHFRDGLHAGLLVAFDFVDANVVFTITGSCY